MWYEKYIKRKEKCISSVNLVNSFGSVARDVMSLEKSVDRLNAEHSLIEKEIIKDKEILGAVISLVKNCILTKKQLNKKVKIEGKDYVVEYLLKTAISELSWSKAN